MRIITLNEFPLKWRWTDEKYQNFTQEQLNLIQPLESQSAKIIHNIATSFLSEKENNNMVPNENIFKNIDFINANDFEQTKIWLKNKIDYSKIFISWSEEIAIITDSQLFLDYWDDFCYPSSDDVSIWTENENFIINYSHSDIFWYGKRKK